MIEFKSVKDLARLRRLALASQGLLQKNPFGRGLSGARKAVEHIGYVQIDTISVVERAHHHVLHSRVPKFEPTMTNQLLLDGDVFEYWSHAAAFLPIGDFRFSLPYKNAIKGGQTHWYKEPDEKLMAELLARIAADGPLRSRNIETKSSNNGAGWWDWKPAKKALEQLYMQGDLMVCSCEGFQKVYDLTERVLPSHIDTTVPSMDEFANHLLEQQLRCHGLVSLKGLTYLRRNTGLRKAMKSLVDERLAQDLLAQVTIPNGDIFVIEVNALERRLPRLNNRLLILSPFDNSVIQRDRLKSLFQYDYQIECYVPEPKRQYGYFCLPLLFRGEFIGRMDCKAHRKERRLEIKSLYLELRNETQHFDDDLVIGAFVEAIKEFSQFQQCDSISLTAVEPKHFAQPLRNLFLQMNLG
ncbi:YcaQ family DNA glycosylase [Marinomonas rhizomae]|uniref:winged helix-turn-helix domain-containing protein n=1 Tax=Marinomonas rhizomae TaxID=491948 RepID=UPI002105E352|nr:crosslink repair DNA glycosylase YcaQ family protein [Marinomonas rhizomae]UTV98970.1 YcaQ family DNA glycosylase [Marinomonas rhizomae]